MTKPSHTKSEPNLFSLLGPYRQLIIPLLLLALVSNALTLWLPRLLARGIDAFLGSGSVSKVAWEFTIVSVVIFILTYLQGVLQTVASEKVARDLRHDLTHKISTQSYADVEKHTPAKLLTNLTSDIDAVKNFVSQAVVTLISSIFLILGTSVLLLSINWKLGLAVLSIIPVIGVTFFVIFGKVRVLFLKSREVIDWLNKVINESILGAALIRVLHSQKLEHSKFLAANQEARDVGTSILKLFSAMIPVITFTSNLAVLIILVLGGKFIIGDSMSLGDFASFQSYLFTLVFPIILIGFMSSIMAQAQASYARLASVLSAPSSKDEGTVVAKLAGDVEVQGVTLVYGDKYALKDVNIKVKAGGRTAIIGPTAAGKTQLLNVLIGLVSPTKGTVRYDGVGLDAYIKESLYSQVGLVFQDSVIFNISLRENIAFNTSVSTADLERAIQTAELSDFVASLAKGLDTMVSERGTSLSGGQKQRIMLARALAINPKVLLLDDFTARVDAATEKKILENIRQNYPDLTLISVTQKIASVESFDQIVVLMEGEVIATGTHDQLLHTSPEYVQIYNSQESTLSYELQSE